MTPFDLAAARAFSERHAKARQFSNVGDPLSINRPTPVMHYRPTGPDNRPQAADRAPCTWCNTRGDIGCRHQAPCEPVQRPDEYRGPSGRLVVAIRRFTNGDPR